MKYPGKRTTRARNRLLLDLLSEEFRDPRRALDLINEFLQRRTFDKPFFLKLLTLARQRSGVPWNIRRLAVLMLENQVLRIDRGDLDRHDLCLTQLGLKPAAGTSHTLVSSVLREGYSTIEFRRFVPEFRRRLERLNRVHRRIRGRATSESALRDFIKASRDHCKLTLGRYLFTPEEIVDEILRQARTTRGVKDIDDSEPAFVEGCAAQALSLLPDFEARILRRLCQRSNIFWVSKSTSSEINSLLEYPLTTVVLVIKPPGSDIEFELKRAGLRGENSLSVIFARNGYTVAPSHRLDGGCMRWLLRFEAEAAARLASIYRLVHETEAPMPNYIVRNTIYSVPVNGSEVQTPTYFTDPGIFGRRFGEMQTAMRESVDAFKQEGHTHMPDLSGAFGVALHFIGLVAPAQAVLTGTTAFRLDKVAAYLSDDGAEQYFTRGLRAGYNSDDARRFADAILEEVLGSYASPDVRYQTHGQYLSDAFRVRANRARADRNYLSLIRQIGTFWGTLLAVGGYSRGESFVARNVGLKSYWHEGQWKVRIIFMDHDALVISGPEDRGFQANGSLQCMRLDETYIFGRANHFATSEIGYLRNIYRVGRRVSDEGDAVIRTALLDAYKKTRHAMLTNPKLRTFFHGEFVKQICDWDTMAAGYAKLNGDKAEWAGWKRRMTKMLKVRGYRPPRAFQRYLSVLEKHKAFIERYSFLYDSDNV